MWKENDKIYIFIFIFFNVNKQNYVQNLFYNFYKLTDYLKKLSHWKSVKAMWKKLQNAFKKI